MKKFLIAALCVIMAFALMACSSSSDANDDEAAQEEEQIAGEEDEGEEEASTQEAPTEAAAEYDYDTVVDSFGEIIFEVPSEFAKAENSSTGGVYYYFGDEVEEGYLYFNIVDGVMKDQDPSQVLDLLTEQASQAEDIHNFIDCSDEVPNNFEFARKYAYLREMNGDIYGLTTYSFAVGDDLYTLTQVLPYEKIDTDEFYIVDNVYATIQQY